MESNSKIWVVILVILIIQTIIFFYMYIIDKKIEKIEKQQNNFKNKDTFDK